MSRIKLDLRLGEFLLRLLFIVLSIWMGIIYYQHGNMVRVVSALLSIGLFLLPALLSRVLRFSLPVSFRMVWLLFISASMYLGELHNFFYRFAWWDDLVHTCTGMLVTYLALILIHIVNRDRELHLHLKPLGIALSIFTFTIAFGAVWELFEFSVDQVLGLNLLKGRASTDMHSVYDSARALANTMQDLAEDVFGALVVALLAFLHYKRLRRTGKPSPFGVLAEQFIRENERLFSASGIPVS